jgi:hypothetical protein
MRMMQKSLFVYSFGVGALYNLSRLCKMADDLVEKQPPALRSGSNDLCTLNVCTGYIQQDLAWEFEAGRAKKLQSMEA